MTRDLEMAIVAALKAGKAIMEIYRTEFSHTSKEDLSPVTKADIDSHRIIASELEALKLPVLSEEGRDIPYGERSGWKEFWIVDPLDGTKEFIKRNGEFTVNIAKIADSYPILGVIYAPAIGQIYYADHHGAFRCRVLPEENPGPGSIFSRAEKLPLHSPRDGYVVVCSRSHITPATTEFLAETGKQHHSLRTVSIGSSLKFCLVAEGSADCYPRLGPTMEWDTAAGQAIAEVAGATVNDYGENRRLRYNKKDLLNPWFMVSRV